MYGSGEAKECNSVAEGKPKARRQRGAGCARPKSLPYDPKPGDLGAGRVKRGESLVEARRGVDVQIAPLTRV